MRVFVSYEGRSADQARRLMLALEKRGLDTFFAPRDMVDRVEDSGALTPDGNNFLVSELSECGAVVFLVTPEFLLSKYCQLERGLFISAVGDRKRAVRPTGIAVCFDAVDRDLLSVPGVERLDYDLDGVWLRRVADLLMANPEEELDRDVIQRESERLAALAMDGPCGADLLEAPALDFPTHRSRHEGVVLIKPPACRTVSAVRKIIRRLLGENINIIQMRRLTGAMIGRDRHARGASASTRPSLFDEHYFGPVSVARQSSPELSDADRDSVQKLYGEHWHDTHGEPWDDSKIMGASALLSPPYNWSEDRVSDTWDRGRDPNLFWNERCDGLNKIGPQKSAFPMQVEVGGRKETRLILNGYVYGYRRLLTQPRDEVTVVALRVATFRDWADVRDKVLGGQSNPAQSLPGSLRRQASEDPRSFGLKPEEIDGQRNLVHSSASLLEGLREIHIWFDCPFDETDLGRYLAGRIGDKQYLHRLVFDSARLLIDARDKQFEAIVKDYLGMAGPPPVTEQFREWEAFRSALVESLERRFVAEHGPSQLPQAVLRQRIWMVQEVKDVIFFAWWVHQVGVKAFVERFVDRVESLNPSDTSGKLRRLARQHVDAVRLMLVSEEAPEDGPRHGMAPELIGLAAAVICSDLTILATGGYHLDFQYRFEADLDARALDIATRIRSNALRRVATGLRQNQHQGVPLAEHPVVVRLKEHLDPVEVEGTGLVAVVAAGGRSTRVQSIIPKPVLRMDGKYIAEVVRDNIALVYGDTSTEVFLSVGWERELIQACLRSNNYRTLELPATEGHVGLGPAVRLWAALQQLSEYDGIVMSCYADMPCVTATSIERLLEAAGNLPPGGMAFLTAHEAPVAGRVLRDAAGRVVRVAHDRLEAQPDRSISERDVGFYAFRNDHHIRDALGRVSNNNIKQEYGIHQLVEEVARSGRRVATVEIARSECWTINHAADIAWLGLGGHRVGREKVDIDEVYRDFRTQYGVTFSQQELEAVHPMALQLFSPDHAPRPQAPLHFLLDLIRAEKPA